MLHALTPGIQGGGIQGWRGPGGGGPKLQKEGKTSCMCENALRFST